MAKSVGIGHIGSSELKTLYQEQSMRNGATLAGALMVSLMTLAAGCTNTNSGADKAVGSLADTRVEVVKAQNDLYDTLKALDGLQNASGDMKPAYANFKTAMAATDRQKDIAQRRAVAMRENSAAYQAKWEQESKAIDNPDLKASSEERMSHVRQRYDNIREIAGDCRKQYAVLHSDLTDIDRYLANDLNAAALDKAKPTIANARKDGDRLSARLNDLVAEMNQLTAEMNPTGKVPER
jgi:chromosome segregation ATPase